MSPLFVVEALDVSVTRYLQPDGQLFAVKQPRGWGRRCLCAAIVIIVLKLVFYYNSTSVGLMSCYQYIQYWCPVDVSYGLVP